MKALIVFVDCFVWVYGFVVERNGVGVGAILKIFD